MVTDYLTDIKQPQSKDKGSLSRTKRKRLDNLYTEEDIYYNPYTEEYN